MSLCKCVTSEFTIEHNNQFFPKLPSPGNSFPGFIAGKWVVNCSRFGFSGTASLKKKSQHSLLRNLRNAQTTTSGHVFPFTVLNLTEHLHLLGEQKTSGWAFQDLMRILCIKVLVLKLKEGRGPGGGVRLSRGSWDLVPKSSLCCRLCCSVPLRGAMNWQLKPVQEKSCACCHQLLLRSKRAISIRAWEEWKEGAKLRIHWVGWQVILCRSCFSLSPGEKRAWSHTSSLFALKGHWRKVQNHQSFHFVGLVVLHRVLGSYHIMGRGEKRCQMVFPKSSTWRGTFCTHQRPGVHKSAFWSPCCTVYLTVPLAKNYSAGRMTHRSVVHILRNCGELQAAWVKNHLF